MNITTIRVEKKTKELLNTFKIHSRQTDDEILTLLLIHCKEAIKRGDLEVYKKGKKNDRNN